jgi:hypothetical protein
VIEEISDILSRFESCFHRRAAFSWFVVIIFGLLVRLDQLVTLPVAAGLSGATLS